MIEDGSIKGVTIHDVSSELTGGFDRRAAHLIDGSGLSSVGHSPFPDMNVPGGSNPGTMWLTGGTLREPHDRLPAHVTFDLGASYKLTGIHIWNYNEQLRSLHSRSAREVEISISRSLDSHEWIKLRTDSGNFEFPQADGTATEPGFPVRLEDAANAGALGEVRLVRFTILSTHGPNPQNEDPDLAGLSEVRFFGQTAE